MGAEIGVGALLGAAGISALGNLAGSAISASGAESTNRQAMAFNALEAQKNRVFQKAMYSQQLADQERMYNQYQSPEAIAKQLEKIGVNAAGAFAGGKSGFSGSMSGVPSVPSGSQASIGSLENPYSSFGQALQNTTKDAVSVLNSLTDKHLKDAQSLKVLADKKGQDYANQIAKIQSQVSEWQIPAKAKAEINELITSAALNEANGRLAAAETSLKTLMGKLTDNQIRLTDEQIQQLTIEVAWLDKIRRQEFELLGEKKKTEKSYQAANYGSAAQSNATAEQIEAQNKILNNAKYRMAVLSQTLSDADVAYKKRSITQAQYELLKEQIERAKKENDIYKLREYMGMINETISSLGHASGEVGRTIMAAKFMRGAPASTIITSAPNQVILPNGQIANGQFINTHW